MDVVFDNPDEQFECPICATRVHPGTTKPLYDIPVCKACSNRFARRRRIAFAIDATLWEVPYQVILLVVAYFLITSMGLERAQDILGGVFLEWVLPWIILPLIFSFKDGFSGMSPGKRWMGLQVVDAVSREPIGFRQSLRRNLGLIIPIVPLIIASQMRRGRRCGDRWAGTTVIWRKYRDKPPFNPGAIRKCEVCGGSLVGHVGRKCPDCGWEIRAPMARPAAVKLARPALIATR